MIISTFVKNMFHFHRCSKHMQPKQFKCECCRCFAVEADLRLHRRSVHDCEVYICDICLKEIKLKTQFNDHQAMHRGEKNYTTAENS